MPKKYTVVLILVILVVLGSVGFWFYKNISLQETSDNSDINNPVPEKPDQTENPTKDVSLKVGQSANFDGLNIKFLKIVGDSRCPVDVTCVWAGRVDMQFEIDDSIEHGTVDFSFPGEGRSFGNYFIKVDGVVPVAVDTKNPVDFKDYLVKINVMKDSEE